VFSKAKKVKRLSQPRAHHYVFAHHVVRQVCAGDSLQFFSLVASAEQRRFLEWMWKEAERHAKEAPQGATVDDVKVAPCRIKGRPSVVVTMPTTVAMAEAHMVAAVLMDEPTESAPNPPIRYFTLEDGENMDGSARTVFCEWTEEKHANYGDGPQASAPAFIEAIERHLR